MQGCRGGTSGPLQSTSHMRPLRFIFVRITSHVTFRPTLTTFQGRAGPGAWTAWRGTTPSSQEALLDSAGVGMSQVTHTHAQNLLIPLSPRGGGVDGVPLPGWSRGLPLSGEWRAHTLSPRHPVTRVFMAATSLAPCSARCDREPHRAGVAFACFPHTKRQGGRVEGAGPCP